MTLSRIIAAIIARTCTWMPDEIYLKIRYRLIMGRKLHLDNPQTFNEKINWLKINYRNPILTSLVDKAEIKSVIKDVIGEKYLIPTLGVWDKFEDIDFYTLPQQFVLKSVNGGGGSGVFICEDKSQINIELVRRRLENSARTNWKINREWAYYEVKPRFIAEKFMKNYDGSELVDYKIMFFNGEPKVMFYATERFVGKDTLKFDWYDMNLKHLPITSKGFGNKNQVISYFKQWDEMKEVGSKLAKHFNLPNVRVDFYLINGQVYLGEMTFYHDAGFVPLEPEEWEYKIGSMMKLPTKYK